MQGLRRVRRRRGYTVPGLVSRAEGHGSCGEQQEAAGSTTCVRVRGFHGRSQRIGAIPGRGRRRYSMALLGFAHRGVDMPGRSLLLADQSGPARAEPAAARSELTSVTPNQEGASEAACGRDLHMDPGVCTTERSQSSIRNRRDQRGGRGVTAAPCLLDGRLPSMPVVCCLDDLLRYPLRSSQEEAGRTRQKNDIEQHCA